MGPSQICECPFREPRVFTIAHFSMYMYIYIYVGLDMIFPISTFGELL